MKCTRCRRPAELKLRAHNSAFCREGFFQFFERRVVRAIERFKMLAPGDSVLVAVSGGKDSLALWDVLASQGYSTIGFHLALGIGDYSAHSLEVCRQFAEEHGLRLEVADLGAKQISVPDLAWATKRPACAAYGTAKRHFFDQAALDHGCNVLATGHNLDDEAARLLGNVMHWQIDHLARQRPVMEPTHPRFVRKIKPLFLTSELETVSWASSPGSKMTFVKEYVSKGAHHFPRTDAPSGAGECLSCGQTSYGEICGFCSLESQLARPRVARTEANPDHE